MCAAVREAHMLCVTPTASQSRLKFIYVQQLNILFLHIRCLYKYIAANMF